mgnify:CR=1 FL=1
MRHVAPAGPRGPRSVEVRRGGGVRRGERDRCARATGSHLRIAGEPFFGKAPLFLWTAALFAKLLGGVPAVHDAARLRRRGASWPRRSCSCRARAWSSWASAACACASCCCIGCLGLLIRAHEMTSDLASLAASRLALYGPRARAPASLRLGGALAGRGDRDWISRRRIPARRDDRAVTLLVLPALGHHWRTPRYLGTVAAAIAVAAPLAALAAPAFDVGARQPAAMARQRDGRPAGRTRCRMRASSMFYFAAAPALVRVARVAPRGVGAVALAAHAARAARPAAAAGRVHRVLPGRLRDGRGPRRECDAASHPARDPRRRGAGFASARARRARSTGSA